MFKIIHTAEDINRTITELAIQISRDYEGKELLLCGILNGAFMFLADLSRKVTIPHKIDFMGASSYGEGTVSTGEVKITKYPDTSPRGKDILIIEDVIETGQTLGTIRSFFLEEGANTVKICSLVIKENKQRETFPVDYYGFFDEDEFIIGYGMDHAGFHRNLPYIGIMEES